MSYLQAAIFDMDGVVIDSAKLHCLAWTLIFDRFLKEHYEKKSLKFNPFTEQDYLYYVDGISRFDGVKRFLKSRHISLPSGVTHSRSLKTIYGLGNRKNSLFHKLLKDKGVVCFSSSITLIKLLREQGIKTALISSSKNCNIILQSAHAAGFFDVILSGNVLEKKHIAGKPQPDIFLEAAKLLKASPANCMVVEDALLGVQAGHAGKFGLVVGVDRKNLGSAIFREYGADIVVNDLIELHLEGLKHWFDYTLTYIFDEENKLNSALLAELKDKQAVLFLDYDGTLTPIVNHPNFAILSPLISKYLKQLSKNYVVAIISGRELIDIKSKVDVPNIYYAGNHGLEISGPKLTYSLGLKFIPEMKRVYKALMKQLGSIEGIFIENKHYSLSVHFRLVADSDISKIQQTINSVLLQHPNFIKRGGKKVIEIRPNIKWDKGIAALWLLSNLKLNNPNVLPIYIGDDTTDEDAFRALKKTGIGIIVSSRRQPTKAKYCLRDTNEVQKFLELLIQRGVK
ncbi:MAG: otsB [Gammaproteobacteria bacterium]|jgi:alpha,alpha-trehalase|nr:otsB [Gammaproteobacteria bacterium]